MYHFKCIVYIVPKDEIRLNEWMPWSVQCALTAETELCLCVCVHRKLEGEQEYWVSVWRVRPWLLAQEPGGKQDAIYMTPEIKKRCSVAFVFAWVAFCLSLLKKKKLHTYI